jgi:hypothetical protein
MRSGVHPAFRQIVLPDELEMLMSTFGRNIHF